MSWSSPNSLPLSALVSSIYAPEVACNSSGAAPQQAALELVGQRIKPVSVELTERALEGMPPTQRKALSEVRANALGG